MNPRILYYASLAVMGVLASAAVWTAGESQIASPVEVAQSAPPPQGGPHGGPPPREAFEACAALSETDACAFPLDGAEITGSCRQPPQGRDNALICFPAQAGNG
ncbi:hypothetical protein [Maliponia aquimaris]|uniref:Uncharacterized protein n=1 Tax=Maliponia aquimaris TaxID=1673631 RepID=A0A238L7B8_9RHOB|nr:hypothetical protein [Maliponia aquimaris]SMX50898.1 hypothetical protein MAA8898_05100 [Maliponia aquimaris]